MNDPASGFPFDSIRRAVSEISSGRPVVVVDDADRENEGDLILAAESATDEWLAFMVRYTSGVVCAPLTGPDLERLSLPPMVRTNEDPKCTAFTVSVDARSGVTTGISAADRARTIRMLAEADATADQFTRPGHVFPLRACAGGVLERPGHTEAAVDLARLAGLRPAGAIAELVNDDGTMARLPELASFSRRHGLALVTIADLVEHRRAVEGRPLLVAETRLPTAYGVFRAFGYVSPDDGAEHLALVCGEVRGSTDVLVRVHSECLTGDTLASLRCDCGPQLRGALQAVAAQGRGIVLYLGGHEGRGIGLAAKLRAYQLQDQGNDTVDANLALGLPADARDYRVGAQILADIGVRSVRLLTNNPAKRLSLQANGVHVVEQLPLVVPPNPDNLSYLVTKRDRMGHCLPGLEPPAGSQQVNGWRRTDSTA